MTTTPRLLHTPSVWSQPHATLRTAQGSHGRELADLADDAASGHCGQRAAVTRNAGGTFHLFTHAATTARFYEVAFTVGWRGSYSPPDGAKVDLAITDGTATVTASLEIPAALQGSSASRWPGLAASGTRLDSLNRVVAHLDRLALISAGLSATSVWRWRFQVTCGSTTCCEALEVVELARFGLDTADAFGDDPQRYQPRGIITDALARTGATLEAAYDLGRRTYHATSLDEAAPDIVTAGSYAAIPGSQTETSGVALPWTVRPRRIKGEPSVLFGVRYKTSGAGAGSLRLYTGGAGSPYTLALPATSGTWSDVLTGSAALADAVTDALRFRAQVASGSLSIASYWVVDAPT